SNKDLIKTSNRCLIHDCARVVHIRPRAGIDNSTDGGHNLSTTTDVDNFRGRSRGDHIRDSWLISACYEGRTIWSGHRGGEDLAKRGVNEGAIFVDIGEIIQGKVT